MQSKAQILCQSIRYNFNNNITSLMERKKRSEMENTGQANILHY